MAHTMQHPKNLRVQCPHQQCDQICNAASPESTNVTTQNRAHCNARSARCDIDENSKQTARRSLARVRNWRHAGPRISCASWHHMWPGAKLRLASYLPPQARKPTAMYHCPTCGALQQHKRPKVTPWHMPGSPTSNCHMAMCLVPCLRTCPQLTCCWLRYGVLYLAPYLSHKAKCTQGSRCAASRPAMCI